MLTVPLLATPSQTLNITLNGQATTLNVYQKFFGLFMDVLVDNDVIISGVYCLNLTFIVRSLYLGFSGDLAFFDSHMGGTVPGGTYGTNGTADPIYTGLGSRYLLLYYAPADLPTNYGLST